MNKGFIVGVGGGANLNYKVVGGTLAPVNPKENTIWVNISTPISSHVFSATQPENPEEGMVWFQTDVNAAEISFNVLKKNVFMLYPIVCKQYIGGAWKMIDANIYLEDSWVNLWNGIFYDNGELFTEYETQVSNATVTINTDAILLTTQKSVDSKAYIRLGKIRIDGISSISASFKVSDTVEGSHYCNLFVGQETGMAYADATTKARTNPDASESSTTTLDLSSAGLMGEYYVYVGTEAPSWANARKINITNVHATR